jgi:hypothetical protein
MLHGPASKVVQLAAGAAGVAVAVASACTYSVPEIAPGTDATADTTATRDGAPPDARGVDVDAADAGGAPPSFCQGITLYLAMDGTLTGAPAYPPVVADGGAAVAQFGPGKFGQAALLSAANSGAYYPASGALGTTVQVAEGSVAMWIQPMWSLPPSVTHAFFKVAGDLASTSAGPASGADNVGLVTQVTLADGGTAQVTIGVDAAAPLLLPSAFNHVVSTWDETSGLLSFTLNGGPGAGAAVFEDLGWAPLDPVVTYFRLGGVPNDDEPDAWVDEVAVWNRTLSAQEIAALYLTGAPLGASCPAL